MNKNIKSIEIPLIGLSLTMLLVCLKADEIINWSWFWILFPTWSISVLGLIRNIMKEK